MLTHDMIAEGVHFLDTDPLASVGWKLIAVNLSDLAAKGAEPIAALMGVSLIGDSDWEEKFLSGVAAACETYGIALIGGDTIALAARRATGVGPDRRRARRKPHPVAVRRSAGRYPVARRSVGRCFAGPRAAAG